MFSDRDHPPEFVDLAHPGADEPECGGHNHNPADSLIGEALAQLPNDSARVDYLAWVWSGRAWPPMEKARKDAEAAIRGGGSRE